jgi:hypothetical protein
MKPIECTIKFNFDRANNTFETILTGFTLLQDKGIIKIKKIEDKKDFIKSGNYCENSIVEVEAAGKRFAYDVVDGYQSFHIKETFDHGLDRLDYYFKSSYDPNFQRGMRNENKVFPLGFSVPSKCKGNPINSVFFNTHSVTDAARKIYHHKSTERLISQYSIENLVSSNTYDNYRLLYWTRLWDQTPIKAEDYQKPYPYLSIEQARYYADKTTAMITDINTQRIAIIHNMKEAFGDNFVYGLYNNECSMKLCPDLVIPNELLDTREAYMNSLKQNYVCIGSYGMHYCMGAKPGEYMSAGRAMFLQPQTYTQPVPLVDGENYVEYSTADDLVKKAADLLKDVERIKKIEKSNVKYFNENCRPDTMILNTLRRVFSETEL